MTTQEITSALNQLFQELSSETPYYGGITVTPIQEFSPEELSQATWLYINWDDLNWALGTDIIPNIQDLDEYLGTVNNLPILLDK